MIRVTDWTVTAGGSTFSLAPLTVRQRLALSDDLSAERARSAAADAALVGMAKADAAEFVAEARRKGLNVAALFLDCYTTQGQIRVLSVAIGSVDRALEFVGKATAREASRAALEALGIDTDQIEGDTTEPASGNA
jgi:hypothetical protein